MLIAFLAIVVAFVILQLVRRNWKEPSVSGSLRSRFPNFVTALRELLGEEVWLGSGNDRSMSYTGKVLSHGGEVGRMQYVLVASTDKAPSHMFQVFQPDSAPEAPTSAQALPASRELSVEEYKIILRRFSQEMSANPVYRNLVVQPLS